MGETFISDGTNIEFKGDGRNWKSSDGNFSTDTKNTSTICSQSGRVESATSRNVETNGNSQEYCWTRGITCESSVKVVGNPDQFEGSTLNKIHDSLTELASLMVQKRDNSASVSLPGLPKLDFAAMTSTLTSSLSSSMAIPTPNIKSLEDIPIHAGKVAAYVSTINASNMAERSARAVALEAERQSIQKTENMLNASEVMLERLAKNPFAGSVSTQDIAEPLSFTIDRQTVYGTVNMDYTTSLERNA